MTDVTSQIPFVRTLPPARPWQEEAAETWDFEVYRAIVLERRQELAWQAVPEARRRLFYTGKLSYRSVVHPIKPPRPLFRHNQLATQRGDAAVNDALSYLRQTVEGRRNNDLNRVAFVLGRHVGRGALELGYVVALLRRAGRALGLPEYETRWVVEHAVAEGMRKA